MSLMRTPKADIGWKAPSFNLPATDGKDYSPENVKGEKGLVVLFICNHCPYVQSIINVLVEDVKNLQKMGFGVIAISSNNADTHPQDSFENMKKLAEEKGFTFPYCYDETQEVAKAYGAFCTPDCFGFDAGLGLQYRGRVDSAGMNYSKGLKRDMVEAMKEVAAGNTPTEQQPSQGCSIKWK